MGELFRFYVRPKGTEWVAATRNAYPVICTEDELMKDSPRERWDFSRDAVTLMQNARITAA